ncbi:hypothetical protein ACFFX1_06295 [Dactylosporangium sucinum]|uniref:Uncharacterized protein n=1 Tax=Dactylosporangium sucinum TaxID=1424081 RepID=A0A917U6Q6_9ACTN|nr:hypothetical protein [Dactylosporangium sucinum]GGM62182.1 hypothetical protein GCM10007977_074640 [Dactylosporangium sucinum]
MDALVSPLLRGSQGSRPRLAPAATAAEVAAITALAWTRDATRLAIGSGRAADDVTTVHAIATRWEALGGEIVTTLTWPETAASWLRQATRFTAADPDLWIMTGSPVGWAQMARRLLWSTTWRPERTILAAALSERATLDLVGLVNLDGITGVTESGDAWRIENGVVTAHQVGG